MTSPHAQSTITYPHCGQRERMTRPTSPLKASLRFVARRFLSLLFVMLGLSLLAFELARLAPGDSARSSFSAGAVLRRLQLHCSDCIVSSGCTTLNQFGMRDGSHARSEVIFVPRIARTSRQRRAWAIAFQPTWSSPCLLSSRGWLSRSLIRNEDSITFDLKDFRTIVIDTADKYSLVAKLDTHRAEIANHVRIAMKTGAEDSNPVRTFAKNLFVEIRD